MIDYLLFLNLKETGYCLKKCMERDKQLVLFIFKQDNVYLTKKSLFLPPGFILDNKCRGTGIYSTVGSKSIYTLVFLAYLKK